MPLSLEHAFDAAAISPFSFDAIIFIIAIIADAIAFYAMLIVAAFFELMPPADCCDDAFAAMRRHFALHYFDYFRHASRFDCLLSLFCRFRRYAP